MNDPHEEDPQDESGDPDWDSFEAYRGPEEEPLHPVVRVVISVLGPILLLVLSFLAGGFLLSLMVLRGRRGQSRMADQELDAIGGVFALGGICAAGVIATILWICLWRRKE
jgi:hypothetical protein